MHRPYWIILGLLLICAGACVAQSDAPSLADIARRGKPQKKAVLVLTDENSTTVPASEASSSDEAASSSTAGNSGGRSANVASKDAGSDRDASTKESSDASELKKKLESLKEKRDSWTHSAKHYEDLLANETSDFRRQMYQDALENDQKNAARYQQEIDKVEGQLAKTQQNSGGASSAK